MHPRARGRKSARAQGRAEHFPRRCSRSREWRHIRPGEWRKGTGRDRRAHAPAPRRNGADGAPGRSGPRLGAAAHAPLVERDPARRADVDELREVLLLGGALSLLGRRSRLGARHGHHLRFDRTAPHPRWVPAQCPAARVSAGVLAMLKGTTTLVGCTPDCGPANDLEGYRTTGRVRIPGWSAEVITVTGSTSVLPL